MYPKTHPDQGLTLELRDGNAGFDLIAPDGLRLPVVFAGVVSPPQTRIYRGAVYLRLENGLTVALSLREGRVQMAVERAPEAPRLLSLSFPGSRISGGAGTFRLENGTTRVLWTLAGGGAARIHKEQLSATLLDERVELEFSLHVPEAQFSAASHTIARLLVPPGHRAPEFSIAAYDYYTLNGAEHIFKRPRPIRLGIPVVSTVPVEGDAMSQEDIDLLELVVGAETRPIYFKVVCDRAFDNATYPATLQIALPNGLDTVLPFITLPLTYIGEENGQNVYKGEYTFHREDTIRYVDGFAYLGVSVPTSLMVALGMTVQVTDAATGFAPAAFESIADY